MDFRRLIDERMEWHSRNFPGSDPQEAIFGCMEEAGELAHAHLKEIQGIRVNEDHVAKAKDAIGDLTIFLLGPMNQYGFLPLGYQHHGEYTADEALLKIGWSVGYLCNNLEDTGLARLGIGRIMRFAHAYCKARDWDYEAIVESTWQEVKQRDWTKNKQDGSDYSTVPKETPYG